MRCPDCSKFVSFDIEGEPELSNEEVNNDGLVTCEARITNNCAECSTELKEATFSIEIDLTDQITAHRAESKKCAESELSVEVTGTRTERTQDKDRHGKPLKGPSRYRKHYYGCEVTATVTCGECDENFEESGGDEVQASGMDELG